MALKNYTPIHHLLSKKPAHTPLPPHVAAKPTPAPSTKESEPVPTKQEVITFNEPLESKYLDGDVKPYVNVRKEKVEISAELKKIGLKEVDPELFKDARSVKLPLSDDKIVLGLHAPITSAFRWLAMFALYLLQQSHMTLKEIHGRTVRVVRK